MGWDIDIREPLRCYAGSWDVWETTEKGRPGRSCCVCNHRKYNGRYPGTSAPPIFLWYADYSELGSVMGAADPCLGCGDFRCHFNNIPCGHCSYKKN